MKPVTIYVKPTCPFCKRALQILKRAGVTPTIHNITNNNSLRKQMVAEAKQTTVPQIFIGNTHVGGCDSLIAAQKAGKLSEMLS